MKMTARTRAIDKVFKRRHRFEIPGWQRTQVWGRPRQQLLIDTILRGWKLPKFTFIKTDSDAAEFEVADGQQRLNAIFEFMSGNLELSQVSQTRFNAKRYADLSPETSDAFDDFEIEFDEIEEGSDEELKEYFRRLQEGMSLNASEKLNAVQSKLRDFCKELTAHKFFTETVAFKDTRYAFFEVISKAAAIEVEGFATGLRIDDLTNVFEAQANFSLESEVAKRLKRALSYLHKALPANAQVTRNRSTTQSLINLASRLVEHVTTPTNHEVFGDFTEHFAGELAEQIELGQEATDLDYLAYQRTVNANLKSGPLTRHQILLRKLFVFDPSFSESFSKAEFSGSHIDAAIRGVASDLREVVPDLNEVHSSSTGHDLFKITTKVTKSLNAISETAKDSNSFATLISHLYFVFKESIGKKLQSVPKSFADVNDMRIGMQHDLDQEGPAAAAKKKAAHGVVFKKYLGVTSPALANSDRFTIGQLKVLTALRDDMFQLMDEENP
jgi:hypothetical protein